MSKQGIRRLIALLCSLCLLASLAACAGTPQTSAPQNTTQTPADSPKGGTPSESGAPAPSGATNPYPDPNKKVKFDLFVGLTWLGFTDTDTGIVPEQIEKQTGVTFNMTKATDAEQLPLLISSGTLPDLVLTASATYKSALSDPDYCLAYEDLIQQYAPDWEISDIVKKINSHFSKDGKYYMLMNYFNTAEEIAARSQSPGPNFNQFHMRADIYKELGEPDVRNEEQFFALLAQVKEKYPDMIPLVMQPRNPGAFGHLVGFDLDFPMTAEGKPTFMLSDPNYKEFLRVINRAVREGYLLEENFAYTDDEQFEKHVASGKAFMATRYAGNDEQQLSKLVQQAVPEASFIQMKPMEKFKSTQDVSGWSALFISKQCKDPETAIKLVRWAKEPENQNTLMLGERGKDWDYDANGELVLGARYMENEAKGENFDALYKPMHFVLAASDYLTESAMFYTRATDRTKEIFQEVWPKLNFTNIIPLSSPPADSDERIVYDKLGALVSDEYFAKVCTAKDDATFEAMYQEMMNAAKDIGLEKYNAYVADAFDTLQQEIGTK